MKLGQLISRDLDGILGRCMKMSTSELKGSTLVKIIRIAKKAAEEAKTFDEARIKLCEGLAKKDADGKPIMFEIPMPTDQVSNGAPGQKSYDLDDEAIAKLNKEMQGMLDGEVKVEPTLTADEFDNSGLTGVDLMPLEPFIKG